MTSRILRKSSRMSTAAKPDKPYPELPLTAHATGKWCKKVRGKIHYFGSWDDPTGAINEWLAVKNALLAGADPKQNEGWHDIGWLVNAFLDSKEQQKKHGDLSQQYTSD